MWILFSCAAMSAIPRRRASFFCGGFWRRAGTFMRMEQAGRRATSLLVSSRIPQNRQGETLSSRDYSKSSFGSTESRPTVLKSVKPHST
jgi:hypothetical protein